MRIMHTRIASLICLLALPWLSGCLIYPHYDKRSPEVNGRVIDAESHQPLAGASVSFSSKRSLSAKTDTNGYFIIKETRQWEPLLGVGICGPEYKIGDYYYPEYLDIAHPAYLPLQLGVRDYRELEQAKPGALPHQIRLRDIALKPIMR